MKRFLACVLAFLLVMMPLAVFGQSNVQETDFASNDFMDSVDDTDFIATGELGETSEVGVSEVNPEKLFQIDGVFEMTDDSGLIIPENVTKIEEEAFMGDTSLKLVIIPKNVEKIGSHAFANCPNLTEIYFGNNKDLEIASDAFEGCPLIQFYTYPDTSGELYALAHGHKCNLMEEGSTFLQKALSIVTKSGGSETVLQGDFTSMRLIVKTVDDHLPDISEHNPVEIARDEKNTYLIRFEDVEDTINCWYQLNSDDSIIFADTDENLDLLDDVYSSSIDVRGWEMDDPMGFDEYSAYVAENSSEKTVTIAVLDSGVSEQAYYSNKLVEGRNFVSDGQGWNYDPIEHGSVIASIIKDCVGDANVKIMPIRVVGSSGIGSLTLIGAGIKAAIDGGVDIINISMAFDENAYVSQWIRVAVSRGIKVVVAAGNNSRDIQKVYPANQNDVVVVSGIDSSYNLSATSNYGSNIAYCAPDTGICTAAYPNVRYSGTSFAAPMISAALALLQLDPYHTIEDLNGYCMDLGNEGKDSAFGYGLPQLSDLSNVYTESIELENDIPAQIALGSHLDLTWNIFPEYATDKSVTITSSDPDVIRVDRDEEGGVSLVAIGKGSATVTIQANNAMKDQDVSVTSSVRVVQPVTAINIVGGKEKLTMNRTLHLSAEIVPEDPYIGLVEWHSTNENIATVSEEGVVTPVALGSAGIYATAVDGFGASSSMLTLQVLPIPDAEEVVLSEESGLDISSGSYRMAPGTSIQLKAAILPEEAEQIIVWGCHASPEGSITIDADGTVTASAAGTATVTATAPNGIHVALSLEAAVLPTTITVSGTSIIDVGSVMEAQLTFIPDSTTDKSVVWTSTKPSVATVDQVGVVTGKGSGTASIIATSKRASDVSGSMTITVRQPFTLVFNANGGMVETANKTVYSGYAVESLPTPSRDYYNFLGWFTEPSGGSRVTEESRLESTTPLTVYAHWELKPLSDWVLELQVPSGAIVENRKTETASSTTSSTLDGWNKTSEEWKAVGPAVEQYYSTEFPGGFLQNHWIYQQMLKGPVGAYENATNKRVVSNQWAGYVYWHWTYNSGFEGNSIAGRHIFTQSGTGYATRYGYYHRPEYHWGFGAFASPTNYPYYGTGLSENTGTPSYTVTGNVYGWNVNGEWGASRAFSYGCTRWFRFNYYKSVYTDYVKKYNFTRTLVQYRAK